MLRQACKGVMKVKDTSKGGDLIKALSLFNKSMVAYPLSAAEWHADSKQVIGVLRELLKHSENNALAVSKSYDTVMQWFLTLPSGKQLTPEESSRVMLHKWRCIPSHSLISLALLFARYPKHNYEFYNNCCKCLLERFDSLNSTEIVLLYEFLCLIHNRPIPKATLSKLHNNYMNPLSRKIHDVIVKQLKEGSNAEDPQYAKEILNSSRAYNDSNMGLKFFHNVVLPSMSSFVRESANSEKLMDVEDSMLIKLHALMCSYQPYILKDQRWKYHHIIIVRSILHLFDGFFIPDSTRAPRAPPSIEADIQLSKKSLSLYDAASCIDILYDIFLISKHYLTPHTYVRELWQYLDLFLQSQASQNDGHNTIMNKVTFTKWLFVLTEYRKNVKEMLLLEGGGEERNMKCVDIVGDVDRKISQCMDFLLTKNQECHVKENVFFYSVDDIKESRYDGQGNETDMLYLDTFVPGRKQLFVYYLLIENMRYQDKSKQELIERVVQKRLQDAVEKRDKDIRMTKEKGHRDMNEKKRGETKENIKNEMRDSAKEKIRENDSDASFLDYLLSRFNMSSKKD